MSADTILPFGFPAVARKMLTVAFDRGRVTAHGGVLLLGALARRSEDTARLIADPRNPAFVIHSVNDSPRARIPAFKLACIRPGLHRRLPR